MSWQSQDDGPELALAIPNRGDVSFDWAVRFHVLSLPPHTVSSKTIAPIDLAREQTVENALEAGAEWILMLDSDVLPPKDVFQRLRSHNLDIVSGMYFAKKDPAHPAMWNLNEEDSLSPVIQWADNGIVDVDAVGLGCTLVHRRVFEDLEKPWFRWTEGYEQHPWDTHEHDGRRGIGEDFYFCHKAREAGYNIYVDTAVKCDHEVYGVLNKDGYVPLNKRGAQEEDEE